MSFLEFAFYFFLCSLIQDAIGIAIDLYRSKRDTDALRSFVAKAKSKFTNWLDARLAQALLEKKPAKRSARKLK